MADKKTDQSKTTNSPQSEDHVMRSELEELQFQMSHKTNESLDSTQLMLTLCEESKDSGIRTLGMLDEQGEQLGRIEEGVDHINHDLRDAEENLEGLEKCCGLCVLPWRRARNLEKGGDSGNTCTWSENEHGQTNVDGPQVVVGDQSPESQGGYITRIINDAHEDEMEQNLSQVNGMIGERRNLAIDMGNEIDSHNRKIDRINTKTESLDDRVGQANSRANRLLRD